MPSNTTWDEDYFYERWIDDQVQRSKVYKVPITQIKKGIPLFIESILI